MIIQTDIKTRHGSPNTVRLKALATLIEIFFTRHHLNWIEALSLLQEIFCGISLMRLLKEVIEVSTFVHCIIDISISVLRDLPGPHDL